MNPVTIAKAMIPILQHRPILLADEQDFTVDPQTGNGEVRIGQHEFPVLDDDVNELNLARFQTKVTFGPYNLDSDPLLSSQILSSFTGGMGNETLKEGVDDDSFWDATLETRFPDGATLLPLSTAHAGTAAETARPLGDFPAVDPLFYASFGSTLNYWDNATGEFVATANSLSSPPVYRGVEHESLFYIPQGSTGYATMAIDGTITEIADFGVLQFIVWDRKLCALTTDGGLMVKPPGGAFPASVPADLMLPSGNLPRRLVNFMAQDGTPTLYIVTDTLVYAYDPDGGTDGLLYETRLDYPRHPDQGLAATNWRGDTMFVSVGLGIHSYNGTNIAGMGPDGRYGLPARLRGTIVDLAGEYNALLAMVRGTAPLEEADAPEPAYSVNPPLYRDRNTYAITGLPYQPVHSSILRWSNSQWHKVWESSGATGDPTWMVVSDTATDYRLCWGYGTDIYMQDLPVAYQSPKQALKVGQQPFQPSGFLITGWFDADMTAFTKLATHAEVNLEDVLENGTTGGSVTIEYQRNTSSSWNLLGVADTVGKTIMPFKTHFYPSGKVFSEGMDFRRIRFRISYAQTAGMTMLSPLMSSMVFKFIKVPESQLSWSFTVPLTHPEGYKGRSNKQLAKQLDEALFSTVFTPFTLGDQTYRVRVAQTAGGKHTGYDKRGDFRVNLVEVSLGSTRDDTTVIKYVDQA